MSIPLGLLKLIISWLNNRRVYVIFVEKISKTFHTYVGLPQDSSLSPYLFIIYHNDLVLCIHAHSGHIFTDDFKVLIYLPICQRIKLMIEFSEEERTKICNRIGNYFKRWKQPFNLSRTVVQVFHLQVQNPIVDIYIRRIKD